MINYSTAAGGEEGVVVRVGHEQEKQTSLSLLFFFANCSLKFQNDVDETRMNE